MKAPTPSRPSAPTETPIPIPAFAPVESSSSLFPCDAPGVVLGDPDLVADADAEVDADAVFETLEPVDDALLSVADAAAAVAEVVWKFAIRVTGLTPCFSCRPSLQQSVLEPQHHSDEFWVPSHGVIALKPVP